MIEFFLNFKFEKDYQISKAWHKENKENKFNLDSEKLLLQEHQKARHPSSEHYRQ